MSDPHREFTKNDEALDDLNEALRDLSTRSESIVYGQYHSAVAGQARYGLDPKFMQVKFVGFKSQVGSDSRSGDSIFYPLVRGSVKDATIINENQQRGFNPYFYPRTYDISGRSAEEKVVSQVVVVHSQISFRIANPPDSIKKGDRVINITDSNAEGIITGISNIGIDVDGWRGQTTPDTSKDDTLNILSADRETDRGEVTIDEFYLPTRFQLSEFPDGLTKGDIVINTDRDDAETTVEGFIDTDNDPRLLYVRPWGGLKIEDEIRIISPSRSNQTLVIAPPPTFTDTIGAESIYIYAAYYHRTITQSNIDVENDTLDIDPELESALIFLTAHYFAIAQHGVTSGEAQFFEARYEREFHKNIPSVNSRIEEFKSLWFSGAYPHFQERLLTQTSQTDNSGNTVNR